MKRYLMHVGLLLIAVPAIAAIRNATIQIKVLDTETKSMVLDNSGVPKNCDMVNYDAYCHNSIATLITHTLLVQVGDQAPFKVSCRLDSIWSQCRALAKGRTFEAKKEKRGISVYLVDEKGKLRQQRYSYVDEKRSASAAVNPAGTLAARIPAEGSQSAVGAANDHATTILEEGVKCSFTSAPIGAEISVDGRYVGSTPSELSLSAGEHVVEVSLAGFAPWKRNLSVLARSEIRVNAVLQKLQ